MEKSLKHLVSPKLVCLEVLDGHFSWSKEIDNRLAVEDGIWLSEANQELC
jgi:hypothetical protein